MRDREHSASPYLALLGVQVFFGTLPVIGKVVLNVIPAIALVGMRVAITAIVLIVIQAIRKRFWLEDRRDYLKLAILSVFGITLNQLLFISGLSLTSASNTSLLAVTIPIFALSVGAAIGSERLSGIKVAGIILAALGVILIVDPTKASFSSSTTLGDLLIILNSLSFGIYVATSKKVITRNGAFRSMMWVFIFASIFCIPLGAFSLSSIDVTTVGVLIWLLIVYIGIVSTAVPYFLNAWAIARVEPSTVAVFIYLQPLIGFSLAAVILGESIGLRFVTAALSIFAGLFLVTKRAPRRET